MAYVDRSSNTRRTATVIAVAAIQAGAIYAVVTGLAVQFIDAPPRDVPLAATNIRVEPLPPAPDEPKIEKPRLTPQAKTLDPVQRVTPVDTRILEPTGATIVTGLPTGAEVGDGNDTGLIERPRPVPTYAPKFARPVNSKATWATADDYPQRDLQEGNQGVTGFRLSIGTDGRVLNCEVTASSGFPRLDKTACDKISRRARFEAATDALGNKVPGTYSNNIRWQIPN